ncbi:MAG: porin [Anaeromyxobacter sp.]|nr:porin [Anaeromyxobacter sp.]
MLLTSLLAAALLSQAEPASPSVTTPPAAPVSAPAPVVAPAPAPASAAPAIAPKLTVFGFLNLQYSATDKAAPTANTSTFENRRARLGLRGEVAPGLGYLLVYDGADSALKDAYLSARPGFGVEVRAGQLKTPFGYEQSEADTRLLWVYNSAVIVNLARGRDSRDQGVQAAWKGTVMGPLSAEVIAAVVNGAGPNAKDDLVEKNLWSRAGLSAAVAGGTVRLGISYAHGHQVSSTGTDGKFGVQGAVLDDTYFWFHTTGADLTWDSPWAFVAVEAIQSRRHQRRFTAPTASTVTNLAAWGWYAGAYGKTPWHLGPVFRAELYEPNDASATVNDRTERYTVGAYYDVLPVSARFILNYEFDESDRAVRAAASGVGNRLVLFAQVMF